MGIKVKISPEFLAICRSKEQLKMLLEAVRLPQEKIEPKASPESGR